MKPNVLIQWLRQCFNAAPLLTTAAALLAVILSIRTCTTSYKAAINDPDAVVRYQLKQAHEAEQRKLAELAAAEANKTPEQRIAEAASANKAREIEVARERAASEAKTRNEKDIQRFIARYAGLTWAKRCARWGIESRRPTSPVGAEAMRRNLKDERLITISDEMHINEKLPVAGMSACGMFAILGEPDNHNATTTAISTRVQWIYRTRGIYVYTRSQAGDYNGTIESIQH